MSRRYRPFDPFDRGPEVPRPEIHIPRPPRRFWVGLGFFGVALLIFFLAGPVVGFITEIQWYQALGIQDVYLTRIGIEWWLFIGSLVVSFLLAAANVLIALRLRTGPGLRTIGIRRSYLRSGAAAAGLIASALLALILAGGAWSQWQTVALFLHYTPTGRSDPVFGQDVSFYLLTLPLWHAVLNWALGLGFMTALLVLALYAWRGDGFDLRLAPSAVAHLSVLLALIAILVAAGTWVGRYDLLFSHNGVVWGAGFTDVNARLPVIGVEAVLALLLALVLLANVRLGRLAIAVGAIGLWIAAVIVGSIYPATVQRLSVTPAEQTQEAPYIKRQIDGTRQAYGLDAVTTSNYGGTSPLTAQEVADDQATIDNLRLWDYRPLKDTYDQLQTIRTYYSFYDIDLDRYLVEGRYRQLEISAREMVSDRLAAQAQTWPNQHLVYTHGYGVAASPVSAVAGEGLPDYVAGGIPPTGPLKIDQPAIYFGELSNTTVLAPSATQEFDYPKGTQDVYTSYTGTHGVRMDGTTRALWSLRTGDFNLLISDQIQSRTEILYRRNILDRVSAIAPFLSYDSDPYVVVADGKVYWIVDGYTTGQTYPYSEPEGSLNYIRNSVKVVIDAYEGTPTFYVNDPKDPILRAYRATFPSLFRPIDEMPASLRAHVRYPEDLFTIQANVFRTYHMLDPRVFYNREDVWAYATEQTNPQAGPQTLQPYYVLMRLPGQTQPEYLLILPFTPRGKQNMVAWLAARNDTPHYGELVNYVLPKDQVIFGPAQVANRISQKPEVSRDFSLFNQQGSGIVQGNLLVVPIGDTFLYFEPIYLRATGQQSLPELKRVILVDSTQVVYTDTLANAINALAGQQTVTPTGPSPPTPGNPAVAQLVALAEQHYTAAYNALRSGDLATFGSEMTQVGQILTQLSQLTSGTAPPPSATPSPGVSPRPTASP
jgi:uncharacterized membrane protein (UPF0182 family)